MSRITPAEALRAFGTKANLARCLGLKPPSVSRWFQLGYIPRLRQFELEELLRKQPPRQ